MQPMQPMKFHAIPCNGPPSRCRGHRYFWGVGFGLSGPRCKVHIRGALRNPRTWVQSSLKGPREGRFVSCPRICAHRSCVVFMTQFMTCMGIGHVKRQGCNRGGFACMAVSSRISHVQYRRRAFGRVWVRIRGSDSVFSPSSDSDRFQHSGVGFGSVSALGVRIWIGSGTARFGFGSDRPLQVRFGFGLQTWGLPCSECQLQ